MYTRYSTRVVLVAWDQLTFMDTGILLLLPLQMNGLLLDACYRFKVGVSNSQGMGFPSEFSEEICGGQKSCLLYWLSA